MTSRDEREALVKRLREQSAHVKDNANRLKPYAIEAGFSNFDGTWSVHIKRLPLNLADHEARIADVQWPSKLLYLSASPDAQKGES